MQEINYSSRDIDLLDRQPETTLTTSEDSISIEDVHKSKEDFKQMVESMEKFKSLPRKQRRKILKPSFSSSIKKLFTKKIEE